MPINVRKQKHCSKKTSRQPDDDAQSEKVLSLLSFIRRNLAMENDENKPTSNNGDENLTSKECTPPDQANVTKLRGVSNGPDEVPKKMRRVSISAPVNGHGCVKEEFQEAIKLIAQSGGKTKRSTTSPDDELTDLSWLASFPATRFLSTKSIPEESGLPPVVVAKSQQNYTSSGKPPMKPRFTYTELIEKALRENGELTVSGIYKWISTNYPYFKKDDGRWKNSVRHNLSINPQFRKGGKSRGGGSGHYWTLNMEHDEQFRKWQELKQLKEEGRARSPDITGTFTPKVVAAFKVTCSSSNYTITQTASTTPSLAGNFSPYTATTSPYSVNASPCTTNSPYDCVSPYQSASPCGSTERCESASPYGSVNSPYECNSFDKTADFSQLGFNYEQEVETATKTLLEIESGNIFDDTDDGLLKVANDILSGIDREVEVQFLCKDEPNNDTINNNATTLALESDETDPLLCNTSPFPDPMELGFHVYEMMN